MKDGAWANKTYMPGTWICLRQIIPRLWFLSNGQYIWKYMIEELKKDATNLKAYVSPSAFPSGIKAKSTQQRQSNVAPNSSLRCEIELGMTQKCGLFLDGICMQSQWPWTYLAIRLLSFIILDNFMISTKLISLVKITYTPATTSMTRPKSDFEEFISFSCHVSKHWTIILSVLGHFHTFSVCLKCVRWNNWSKLHHDSPWKRDHSWDWATDAPQPQPTSSGGQIQKGRGKKSYHKQLIQVYQISYIYILHS